MLSRARYMVIAAIFTAAALLMVAKTTSADPNPCSLEVSPNQVASNSQVNFTFKLTNGAGNNPITRILITTPSDTFSVTSASASGWTSTSDSSGAQFTGNTINPGSFANLNLGVQTGDYIAGEINWGLYAFDGTDPDSYGNLVCQNNSPLEMVDSTPHISGITLSNVSSSSVTIRWDTSLNADAQVFYGTTDSYGSSSTRDANLLTHHTITLKNLHSNTAYHYQVKSKTSAGVSDTSSDSTFLTAEEQAPITKLITTPGLAVVINNPSDTIPPTINISTKIVGIVKTFPTISGVAKDDFSVVRVEYSIDGGQNWLPADNATNLGSKNVNFSFIPTNLNDGNYDMLARAIDAGGNIAVTPATSVVVDRLPPVVGGTVISIGPEVLQPDKNGVVKALAGVEEKITTSAVGGATSITISAGKTNIDTDSSSFSLAQASDSGLWSGILSFKNPGTYTLTADSVDGAGNKTSRTLNKILVLPAAKILSANSKGLAGAKVTVYFLDEESNHWLVWDSSAYSQNNPQTTDSRGNFDLFLPPGQYYLTVSSKGYHKITSDIFNIDHPMPVSTTLKMKTKSWYAPSVSWLDFTTEKVKLSENKASGALTSSLIGHILPTFKLVDSGGVARSSLEFLGKPTVLTLATSWAPTATEQLPIIKRLQANKDINAELIALGQNGQQVQAYNQITGYSVKWLADPDNSLSDILKVSSLPTHYFVDRNGVIKKVISGFLSEDDLKKYVSEL